MAFNQLSNTLPSANTFNSTGVGRYMISTWTFGSPQNYYLLSPARNVKGATFGRKTFTDTRVFEADVTVNGVVSRRSSKVSVSYELDEGMDPSFLDSLLINLNELATVSYINRRIAGEV